MNKSEKLARPLTTPRYSATFSNDVNSDIRRAAAPAYMTLEVAEQKESFQPLMICYS